MGVFRLDQHNFLHDFYPVVQGLFRSRSLLNEEMRSQFFSGSTIAGQTQRVEIDYSPGQYQY